MTENNHPLEDEDVFVTVILRHETTGITSIKTAMAPADGGYDVTEAVEVCKNQAMDDLLARVEVQGG